METRTFISAYVDDVVRLIGDVDVAAVEELTGALLEAWRRGGHVLMMGNGGSSSSVSHIVNDMQKNIHLETGRPMRALCLSDCTPLLMAWANDTQWDNVFRPQVECWVEPGDVVIGVSGSGNSMNVINGIEAARSAGAVTFGLAGFSGGKLKDAAEHCLVVRSENMQRIEDVHMVVLHLVFSALQERAREESRAVTAS